MEYPTTLAAQRRIDTRRAYCEKWWGGEEWRWGRELGVSGLANNPKALESVDLMSRAKYVRSSLEELVSQFWEIPSFFPQGRTLKFRYDSIPKSSAADGSELLGYLKRFQLLLLKQSFLLPTQWLQQVTEPKQPSKFTNFQKVTKWRLLRSRSVGGVPDLL